MGLFVSYRKLLEDLGEGPRGAPGGSLDIGREGGDPRFKGHQHEEDCGNGGPSSVSIGNSSAAAPQLRVFGKPTGLVRVSETHAICGAERFVSRGVSKEGGGRGGLEGAGGGAR